MEEVFQEYLDVKSEMEDIADERKEKAEAAKELEIKIKDYLENEVPEKSYECDDVRVYIAESTSTKALNKDVLERLLVTYFNGNAQKARELTEYIWEGREKETKSSVKVGKIIKRRKKPTKK